ncbi:arginase family protein [Aquimarina rhabdastrellae]
MKEEYILSPFYRLKRISEKVNLIDIISGKKFMIGDPYISSFLVENRSKMMSINFLNEQINEDNTSFLIKKKIIIKEEEVKEGAFKTIEYNDRLFNLPAYTNEAKVVLMGIPFGDGNYIDDQTKLFPSSLRKLSKKNNLDFKTCDFNAVGITKTTDLHHLDHLFKNNMVADGGDIFAHKHETAFQIYEKITFFTEKIIARQQIPFYIGGDHSITYAVLRGIGVVSANPFSVIHFDAHTDIYTSEYDPILNMNQGHHHGNFVKKALQLPKLEKYHQFGIRGISNLRPKRHDKLEITYAATIKENLEKIKKLDKNKNYYITLDIDVLDPFIAPATATPEPNGLLIEELYKLFYHLLSEINIIGIDLVEVNPKKDIGDITQSLAIQLLIKLLTYIKTEKHES